MATARSKPVGSVSFLSARFPASLIRRLRIRPLDRFISSSVPELRWQQALPLDCGADPFGSAFCARSFTLENLSDKVGSALALKHSIPRPRDPLLPARHLLPFLLDQSLLKVPVFGRGMIQAANTGHTLCSTSMA